MTTKTQSKYFADVQLVWKKIRVTGPLCGEFTGHRWIASQRPVTQSFWHFLWFVVIWDAIALIITPQWCSPFLDVILTTCQLAKTWSFINIIRYPTPFIYFGDASIFCLRFCSLTIENSYHQSYPHDWMVSFPGTCKPRFVLHNPPAHYGVGDKNVFSVIRFHKTK